MTIKKTPDNHLYTYASPGSSLDYSFNWGAGESGEASWLEEGETIATSAWSVTNGATLSDETVIDSSVAVVVVSGLTNGKDYVLTNQITTVGGSVARTDSRNLTIKCRPRSG